MRIVNHAGEAGEVSIAAVDDTGARFGPVAVSIEAGQAIEFSASDLERGNAQLGIDTGIGAGQGDWRIELETDLPIEPMAHVQAPSGFLDRLDRAVPGGSFYYRVALPAPDAPLPDGGRLRLVNGTDAVLAHRAVRPGRHGASGAAVDLADAAVRWLAHDHRTGAGAGRVAGLTEASGTVRATGACWCSPRRPSMRWCLLEHPSGPLANLSAGLAGGGEVQFLPAAGDAHRNGLLRIGNRAGAGTVTVRAVDDAGDAYGPVALDLEAGRTVCAGFGGYRAGPRGWGPAGRGSATAKATGASASTARSQLDVAAYIRTQDGLLTSVRDATAEARRQHYVPRFGPAGGTSPSEPASADQRIGSIRRRGDHRLGRRRHVGSGRGGLAHAGSPVKRGILDAAALEEGAVGLERATGRRPGPLAPGHPVRPRHPRDEPGGKHRRTPDECRHIGEPGALSRGVFRRAGRQRERGGRCVRAGPGAVAGGGVRRRSLRGGPGRQPGAGRRLPRAGGNCQCDDGRRRPAGRSPAPGMGRRGQPGS